MRNRSIFVRLFCSAAALTAIPLLTGCMDQGRSAVSAADISPYDLEWGSQKSFAEIGSCLRELGISGITDDLLAETEKSYSDMDPEILMNKTAVLLTILGEGTYNEDFTEWEPSNDSVYAFDMEAFRIEQMYTDFLNGIRKIGGGALDFQNIAENMEQADLESGTGTRQVTFEWNGKLYTLDAEVQNDWFDTRVLDQLNDVIAKNGETRRLYAMTDGYQECIVFFCDQSWADAFFEKTGLFLSPEAG